MTQKDKHCVNSRDSCHMKAEGLNFNPRKSWKKASCPVVLTHVTDRQELLPVGTSTRGSCSPRHGVDVKSEEADRRKGTGECITDTTAGGWDNIFAFLDLFC